MKLTQLLGVSLLITLTAAATLAPVAHADRADQPSATQMADADAGTDYLVLQNEKSQKIMMNDRVNTLEDLVQIKRDRR